MAELQLFMLMSCCLSDRQDLSQERAVPVMLREVSRWEKRMAWLMVLKAALRPRRIIMLSRLVSEERRRSLVTLKMTVLVLCCVRNPDPSFQVRGSLSCVSRTRCSIFDRKGRMEMGLK